ncbi:hypothetical protein IPN35_01960 [Candidatus Peregrinibacteria bacterium]|nr:MAG: hypothetical protein IPN35_01960 [Candidatus Peregrinibacteria bacterium]
MSLEFIQRFFDKGLTARRNLFGLQLISPTSKGKLRDVGTKIMNAFKKLKQRRAFAKQHVEQKLLKRLRIFAIIIAIVIGIVVYKILFDEISIRLAIIGLTFGTILGLITGRMFKITWDQEAQKVISRLDKIGVIFLMFYVVIEIGRKWIFGSWLHGKELSAFSLIFLAGLLLGRLLTMMKNIKKALMAKRI